MDTLRPIDFTVFATYVPNAVTRKNVFAYIVYKCLKATYASFYVFRYLLGSYQTRRTKTIENRKQIVI